MIDFFISGNIPTLNTDLSSAMASIASDIMCPSILQNFAASGRPDQWAPLKTTGQPSHLGRMGSYLQVSSGQNFATVFIDTSAIPYATIHNYGGVVRHPGSEKFQVFKIGEKTVFTRGTKAHNIPIPKRTFMMFQDEDIKRILEAIGTAIFTEGGQQRIISQ